jgi:hypothetical protein
MSKALSDNLTPQLSAIVLSGVGVWLCTQLYKLTKRQLVSIGLMISLTTLTLIKVPQLIGYCLIIYFAGYLAIYSVQKRKRKDVNKQRVKVVTTTATIKSIRQQTKN